METKTLAMFLKRCLMAAFIGLALGGLLACGSNSSAPADTATSAPVGTGGDVTSRGSVRLTSSPEWTVLVYMAADNNLEAFSLINLKQMAAIGSSDRVQVVVQVDRGDTDQVNAGVVNLPNWGGTKRLFVEKGNLKELADLGQTNMSDPNTLKDFIIWGTRNYPAKRFALVLWDHGGAWQGFATDDSSGGGTPMPLPQVANALKGGGTTFDLLGFDACLMASTEVALELQPYARVLAASEELEPGLGWDYEAALGTLTAKPDMDPQDWAKTIGEGYIANLKKNAASQSLYSTFSVIDMAQMTGLAEALSSFGKSVNTYVAGDARRGTTDQLVRLGQLVGKARYDTPAFGRTDFIDPGLTFDLGALAANAARNMQDGEIARSAAAVKTALNKAVIYRVAGDGYRENDLSGLSIYLPIKKDVAEGASGYYSKLPGASRTGWPELIGALTRMSANDKTPPVVPQPQIDAISVVPGQGRITVTGRVSDETLVTGVVVGVATMPTDPNKDTQVLFSFDEQPRTYTRTNDYSYSFDGMAWYLDDGKLSQPVFTVQWRPGQRAVFGSYQQTPKSRRTKAYFAYDEATGKLMEGYELTGGALGALLPGQTSSFTPFLLTPKLQTLDTTPVIVAGSTLKKGPLKDGEYLVTVTGFDMGDNAATGGVIVRVGGSPTGAGSTSPQPAPGAASGAITPPDQAANSTYGTHPRIIDLGPGASRSFTVSIDRNRVGQVEYSTDVAGLGGAATLLITGPDGKTVAGGNINGLVISSFDPQLSGKYIFTWANPLTGDKRIHASWTISARTDVKLPTLADLDQRPELAVNFDQPGFHTGRFTVPAREHLELSFEVDAGKTPWLGYSVDAQMKSGAVGFGVVLPDDKPQDVSAVSGLHMGGMRVSLSGTYTLVFDNRKGQSPVPVTAWIETYADQPGTAAGPTPAPAGTGAAPGAAPAPVVITLSDWSKSGGKDYFSVAPQGITTLVIPMDKYVSASASLSFEYPGGGMSLQVKAPSGVALHVRPIESVMTPVDWLITQTGDYAIILDNRGEARGNSETRSVLVALTVRPTNNPPRPDPSPATTAPPNPAAISLPQWGTAGGKDYFTVAPRDVTTLTIPMDNYVSAVASLSFDYPGSGMSFQVKDPRGTVLINRPIEYLMTPITWTITQTGDYTIVLDNRGEAAANGRPRALLVTLTVKPTNNPARPAPAAPPSATMPTASPPDLDLTRPPNMFFGTIRLYTAADKSDAYPAPAGAKVSAVVGGTLWENEAAASGADFDYSAQVRARTSIDTKIEFYVDGVKADQTATWVQGGAVKLDLTVNVAQPPSSAPSVTPATTPETQPATTPAAAPATQPAATPAPAIIRLPDWSTTGGKDYFSVPPRDIATLVIPMDSTASAGASLEFNYPGSGMSFQVKDPRGTVLINRPIEYLMTPINWTITQTGDYTIVLDNRGTASANGSSRTVMVTLKVRPR
ncbi:MAG: hypothetical protein HY671_03925 [Chloroflexi bacterium]|nr:hypothetical protein [Chloroflexota bacterium]